MTTQDYFEHSTAFWLSYNSAPIKHPGEAEVFHALLFFATTQPSPIFWVRCSEIKHRTGLDYGVIRNCLRWFEHHNYLNCGTDEDAVDPVFHIMFTLIPACHEV